MHVDVRGHHLVTEALRNHAERRVEFALDRFAQSVRSVEVHLADVNGPRGGVDKRCRVHVIGRGPWSLDVEAASDDIKTAIDEATGRVRNAVGRTLSKARRHQGRGEARRWSSPPPAVEAEFDVAV